MTAPPSDDWREDAECRPAVGHNPELWFEAPYEPAVRICRQECPVVEECLAWAVAVPSQVGVAGGMTEKQRRTVRLRITKRRAA